ncbi:MAG: peptide deformylase, partial [Chitinophagales bacterium]
MILPIIGYGNPVLKNRSHEVTSALPDLPELLQNMWETMYNGKGVGLAAPQVGLNVRIFIVDSEQLIRENEDMDDEDDKYRITKGIKQAFINPVLLNETGDPWV